jgi:hypothetical protein
MLPLAETVFFPGYRSAPGEMVRGAGIADARRENRSFKTPE